MSIGRMRWVAGCVLAAVSLLSGCSNFWDKRSGGGGTSSASGVFYVLNASAGTVVGYTVPANSTTPTAITNGSQSLNLAPLSMAISPSGSYLYVATVGGIFVYSVSSSGVLSIQNNGQPISNDQAYAMQVDPSGQWLVNVTSGLAQINAVPISASTGLNSSSTEQTAVLATTTPQQVAFSPNGGFIFVALGTGGTEAIPFAATTTTTAPNPFGTTGTVIHRANPTNSSAAAAISVAVDPSSRLLYIGETLAVTGNQTGGLRAFTLTASGVGSEVSGSPFATGGTGPSAILPARSGSFVYAANKAVGASTKSNIAEFVVTTSGSTVGLGQLNSGATIPAGVTPSGLTEENTKAYILATNSGGSPDIIAYTFDSTGKLTQAGTLSTSAGPAAVVSTP